MNTNLLNAVKQCIAQYGDSVLSEPKRVAAFFADTARDVPKPRKNVFVKCLEHPGDPGAYYSRGVSYNARGDYDQAIADFTQALRLNPNDADLRENLNKMTTFMQGK
jgi:tetratricopeptide (TPR) repeat protein